MNMFIYKVVIIFLFFNSICLFAQGIDNSNTSAKSNKFSADILINAKDVKKPQSLEHDNHNGFKTANSDLQKKRQKEDKERLEENKGIITPQLLAKQTYKKNYESKMFKFPQLDMDLGSFHTTSDCIYIISYDFGRFDGDKVQISANGKRIHNNYLLTPRYKTIKIPLDIGINKIEVTALNEGKLSPNTGYFMFIDNNKNVIREGEWMLAEGAKVVVIAVRDKK